MHSDFKFKLQVSKLKIKLNKKLEDYSRERSRAKLVPTRLDRVCKEAKEEFAWMKLVNVDLFRRNLKEAFEGVVDATVDLKFVAIDA